MPQHLNNGHSQSLKAPSTNLPGPGTWEFTVCNITEQECTYHYRIGMRTALPFSCFLSISTLTRLFSFIAENWWSSVLICKRSMFVMSNIPRQSQLSFCILKCSLPVNAKTCGPMQTHLTSQILAVFTTS